MMPLHDVDGAGVVWKYKSEIGLYDIHNKVHHGSRRKGENQGRVKHRQ
jgi:hypothetical protein